MSRFFFEKVNTIGDFFEMFYIWRKIVFFYLWNFLGFRYYLFGISILYFFIFYIKVRCKCSISVLGECVKLVRVFRKSKF